MKVLDFISNNLYSYEKYNDENDQLLYLDYMSKLYKNNYKTINVSPDMAYKYQGNFYGLLKEYDVPDEISLLVLYINGLVSPDEYYDKKSILIPVKPNINSD